MLHCACLLARVSPPAPRPRDFSLRRLPAVLVMEKAAHGSLKSFLRLQARVLPVEDAATCLCQVIDAVAYLHHCRIVHRGMADAMCPA
jgi:serine/threonine protein kinase